MANRAIVMNDFGSADALELSSIPVPEAKPGFVVVRVKAAGINGLDWKIREGYLKDAIKSDFPVVLGLELAGEVSAVAAGGRFVVGERVMGLAASGSGAYADYVTVPEANLVPTPAMLSDATAGALPVAGLTAWQMLHAAGTPMVGETVLVHGASGGVGTLLVQMAKQLGLKVVATGSAGSRSHLLVLGADTVIDRNAQNFEEIVRNVDLVIDLAGADAPDRSWPVLREGGSLVSSSRFDVAAPRTDGRRGIAFQMQPDRDRLASIAESVASGELRVTISETVPLSVVPAAVERNRTGHGPGKTVADLTLA